MKDDGIRVIYLVNEDGSVTRQEGLEPGASDPHSPFYPSLHGLNLHGWHHKRGIVSMAVYRPERPRRAIGELARFRWSHKEP
jgi:hypothetical protein